MPFRSTRTTRRGLFGRTKPARQHHTTTTTHPRRTHHTTTTTTTRPVHHQKRKATIGDKISGAMLKLKGTITRRPGEKV